jgi:hypothetical protein
MDALFVRYTLFMRRRFTGIAALLIVLLTMPVWRACAFAAQRTSGQQDCCPHKELANACCMGAFKLCHATQAPVDATQLPGHDASMPLPPPAALVVVYQDRVNDFKPRFGSRGLPMDHAPPGLVIAATTVLRT